MNNYKNIFDKKGFVLIKNLISRDIVQNLKKISSECIRDAEESKWEHIKVYREYPFFFGRINVFGIDFPFATKQGSSLFQLFKKINYKNIVCEFNNWNNFETELVRLHTNNNFYNYQGFWHRDHPYYPSPDAIQSVIYLKSETGFKLVPKNKNHILKDYNFDNNASDNKNEEDNLGYLKLPEDLYETINADEGDVLFFEAALLHQGFCKKKRIHFLLRHKRNDDLKSRDQFNFTKENFPNYNLSLLKKNYIIKNDIMSKLRRLRVFIFYFLPRFKFIFYNLIKKKKYSISHSTIWQ